MAFDPQRVQSIFMAAVGLDAAERTALLERECAGDAELCRRVEALLRAHDDPENLPPAGEGTAAFVSRSPIALQPGQVFAGRFKLREKLGEGGMGVVYVADQLEPVQRRVALKVIKHVADTPRLLGRFEQERQALALMDHPNIAKVYDAGIAGEPGTTGVPYFVMELIKGVPLTKYCDEAQLTARQRLELFVPVCQAVQHAHQKGVIHRDLKPSNILIGLYDGHAVPKVIDFGVAKATGTRLTDQSIYTEVGSLVGTLEYMSPEQAELNNLDVDTRSDIYALGVILYELLTGSVPFSRKELQSVGFAEMLRIIKEKEPAKPSTRLSGSGELPSVAAVRRTEPKKLAAQVRGELDWIVMKCLEKDRSRRYETANGLAADVMRHLADEPVLASPPSMRYRLRKFLRRNRVAVLAVGFVMMALMMGLAIAGLGFVRARQAMMMARDAARAEAYAAEQARQAQEEANAARLQEANQAEKERQAKQLAQGRLAQIERVNSMLGSIFEDLDPTTEEQGGPALRVQLGDQLSRAAKILQSETIGDPLTVARLRATLGNSLMGLGQYDQALPLLIAARPMMEKLLGPDHRESLNAANNLALAYDSVGQLDKAIPLMEQTLERKKTVLGPDERDTLKTMSNLANMYRKAERPDEALPLFLKVLARMKEKLGPQDSATMTTMNNLAMLYWSVGRLDQSKSLLEELLRISTAKLGPDHPHTLLAQANLGSSYQDSGQFTKALTLLEDTVTKYKAKRGPDHPDTLSATLQLAKCLQAAGQLDRALPLLELVVEKRTVKLGPDHPDTLMAMNELAMGYKEAHQLEKALPLFEETLRRKTKKFGPDDPATLATMHNLAGTYADLRQFEKALPLQERTLAKAIEKFGPDDNRTLSSMKQLANTYIGMGQPTKALPMLEQVLVKRRAKSGDDHPDTFTAINDLASVFFRLKQLDRSIPLFEQLLPTQKKKLGAEHPNTLLTLANLATNYRAANRLADAERCADEVMAAYRKLSPASRMQLSRFRFDAATIFETADHWNKAEPLHRELLEEGRAKFGPADPRVAGVLASLGSNLLKQQKWNEAETVLRECLTTREARQPDAWRTPNTQSLLGEALLAQKKYADAEPLLLKGHAGLKQRQDQIDAPVRQTILIDALERLQRLYDQWGKKDDAAQWRKELEALKAKKP